MMPVDRPAWAEAIPGLSQQHIERLVSLAPRNISKGVVLFRPGETAEGFAVVLSGRVEVNLTGPSGREIMLYSVEPGQSCVQTTLGLMGDEPYTGEAISATNIEVVTIPKQTFHELMDDDPGFRGFVFTSFARRMQDVTRLLERVAFGRVESRLAEALLDLQKGGTVISTQAELAARIGSAREVVSRRMEGFAREGWIETERGEVRILDFEALRQLAASLG